MEAILPQALKLLGIIWINVILSGDNAVVIALACRGLPEDQRRIGMILGAGVAVGLRIVFTVLVAALLSTPFLKIIGGLLLLWIAVKLLSGDDDEGNVKETSRLWHAVWTVVVADAVMSLDNVLAVAGAAREHPGILIVGLVFAVALMGLAANFIARYIERYRWIGYVGLVVILWVALKMVWDGYHHVAPVLGWPMATAGV